MRNLPLSPVVIACPGLMALSLMFGCTYRMAREPNHQLRRKEICEIAKFPLDPNYPLSLHVQTSPIQQITFPEGSQLVIMYGSDVERIVAQMNEFSEFVNIRSGDAALRFVRLLTDDRTKYSGLEEWEGWEIDDVGRLSGLDRRLPPSVTAKIRLHLPVVRAVGDGWEIHRVILKRVPPAMPDEIVEVTETVSRDGEYRKLDETSMFIGSIEVGQHVVRL